jgi:polyhydroxybutyrate depolymerase
MIKKTKLFICITACCWLTACLEQSTAQKELAPASDITVVEPEREYRLFVPTDLPEEPVPLLIAVHGGSGRDYPYPQQNKFEALAEQEGFIIAYPMSELLPGNEGEWQLNTTPESRQDIEYIEALIDYISATHSVDEKRVYATGYSLGSMFTYELACHLSDRFAAIASHAGTMPVAPYSCDPESNVAVMHLHGTDDYIISYNNTWDWKEWDEVGTMMDIPSLVRFWAEKYNCQNETEMDTDPSRHIIHDNCDEGVRVEHHRLDGMGHEWPEEINGNATNELIWNFLSSFTKP